MNVIILAGGYAKRLWPLTELFPKPLLKIAGKPALYYLLENISRVPDIDNIIIAIDHEKSEFFKSQINDINIFSKVRPFFSIHESYSNGTIKGPLTKLIEIINDPKKFNIKGEDFFVIGGDNVFGFDLNNFCSFYRKKEKSCIAIQTRIEAIDASEFGIPILDHSGRLKELKEKPKEGTHIDISTACYLFKRDDISRIKEYITNRNEDNLGLFLQWLHVKSEIMGYKFNEDWQDIGTREGILAANAFLMKGKDPNATFSKYKQIPPVYIEKDAPITNSCIGPNVYIGSKSVIIRSNIKNSIIYENCKVQNCNIMNSVVGPSSFIEGNISEAVFGPNSLISIEK